MGRVKKKTPGFGYKYASLADINKWLEEQGLSYYQFINVLDDGSEQVMTVRIDKDGNESKPIPGCIVTETKLTGKNNPAQEHGAALTYARRYSLCMAYGIATEDDDAESLNESMLDAGESMHTQIRNYCNRKQLLLANIVKEFGLRGMTEDELKEMFTAIKDKYGE